MKIKSAKQKGRNLVLEIVEMMHRHAPWIAKDDIRATSSGVTGADITFSKHAAQTYPFAVECKNQEQIQIWKSFEQAKTHVKDISQTPILFFRRNKSVPMVCLRAEDFFRMIKKEGIDNGHL